MADFPLTPNEVARRLAANRGVVGPKLTVTLEPSRFEDDERYVLTLMKELRLVTDMLQLFFGAQGLQSVTLKWEGLQMVKK